MKKKNFYVMLAAILVFCVNLAYAQQEANQIMRELNKELEREKVFLPEELKDMDSSLRNCLEHGVKKEDLKGILLDLKNNQTKAGDTKKTIDVMVDLIKSGVSAKEAGNIVSQAAHLAKEQGLKGTALAARVREAIQIRKAEQVKIKQQNREMKEHQEQHMRQKQFEMPGGGKEKEQERESHGRSQGKGRR